MCKKSCKECPFLKNSLPDWLGNESSNPQAFIDFMEYDIIPCHMNLELDEEAKKKLIIPGEFNPCIGALQFCANSIKIPRGAREEGTVYSDLIDKAKKNPEVFQWSKEFIDHHTNQKLFKKTH